MIESYWSSDSEFERQAGYVRVRRHGNLVFVSGTTGFDYSTMLIADDLVDQVHQAVRNVSEALNQVDSNLTEVVRVNWIIVRAEMFSAAGAVLRSYFQDSRPVMTTLVCGLVDPRMKFEIEVTAISHTVA